MAEPQVTFLQTYCVNTEYHKDTRPVTGCTSTPELIQIVINFKERFPNPFKEAVNCYLQIFLENDVKRMFLFQNTYSKIACYD